MTDWLEYSGWIIGFLSFAYALYADSRRRRMKEVVRSNNWFLFSKSDNATGHTQLALARYKDLHKDDQNPEMIEILSKGDAFGQDVLKDVIRLIQMNEPSFSDVEFAKWAAEGKFDQAKVGLFRKHSVAPEGKRRWWKPKIN